ncbi:MAG: serine/threonine protein kinase [Planctomycetes bacterium]|nr:serine/threonine protein kinase [Planctomycetota bacterium]
MLKIVRHDATEPKRNGNGNGLGGNGNMAEHEIRGYQVLEKVGTGARSVIYKVREKKTGHLLAIKRVRRSSTYGDKFLRHVKSEFASGQVLQDPRGTEAFHPNIVMMHRLRANRRWLKVDSYDLIMDYIEGKNLDEQNHYTPPEFVRIFLQVSKALRYIHARNMVHADIKPNNIIVSSNGKATLIDFGFSCRAGTRLSSIKGTRDYIAPEQVDGGIVDERTDIYNLGAAMYKLLAGRPLPALIPEVNGDAHFIAAQKVAAVPLHKLRPDIPRSFADLIMKCCEKDPAKRPQSILEVISVLEAVQVSFEQAKQAAAS